MMEAMSSIGDLPQPSGTILLRTGDKLELKVSKEQLCQASKFFQDLLCSCDTQVISIDETKDDIECALNVIQNIADPCTFDTKSSVCWSLYKRILVVADKYDMVIVKERCEKWLISRCLRGTVRCSDFKFQDVTVAFDWLALCQKYEMRDLGWYCAYDLGFQLARGSWPHSMTASEVLKDVQDPELLKVILQAVKDKVVESPMLSPTASESAD